MTKTLRTATAAAALSLGLVTCSLPGPHAITRVRSEVDVSGSCVWRVTEAEAATSTQIMWHRETARLLAGPGTCTSPLH